MKINGYETQLFEEMRQCRDEINKFNNSDSNRVESSDRGNVSN